MVHTVKVSLCKSYQWIFTQSTWCKNSFQKYGWIFTHDIQEESFAETYSKG